MKIIMVMAKHVLAAVAVARGALIWILDKVAGPPSLRGRRRAAPGPLG